MIFNQVARVVVKGVRTGAHFFLRCARCRLSAHMSNAAPMSASLFVGTATTHIAASLL